MAIFTSDETWRQGAVPSASENGWVKATYVEGWIHTDYLHQSAEGTRDHGRLVGEGNEKWKDPLDPSERRCKEVKEFIRKSICPNHDVLKNKKEGKCCCQGNPDAIEVKNVWAVRGLCLGQTGMLTGPKETLFHGCSDETVEKIFERGFDDAFSGAGAFGKGLYFSPQACKAWSYSEDKWKKIKGKYLLVCEVALGLEEKRLTVTSASREINKKYVDEHDKRSVQAHRGEPYQHEERVVYYPTQCKLAYIVETNESPGGGV